MCHSNVLSVSCVLHACLRCVCEVCICVESVCDVLRESWLCMMCVYMCVVVRVCVGLSVCFRARLFLFVCCMRLSVLHYYCV